MKRSERAALRRELAVLEARFYREYAVEPRTRHGHDRQARSLESLDRRMAAIEDRLNPRRAR